MKTRRDVFQAIADPTRRAILALVAFNGMTPGAIAEQFDSTRQTISKHIQILTECHLLRASNSGREMYYHFNPERMKEVADWVEPYRQLWEGRLSAMDLLLTEMKAGKKNSNK